MDLSQIVNSNVPFSKTTLEDIVARYSVKAKSSTSTTNKTPASVRTTLSALGQAYARVHGNRTADYGDVAHTQQPPEAIKSTECATSV